MRQSGLLLDDNRDVSEACATCPLVEIGTGPGSALDQLQTIYKFWSSDAWVFCSGELNIYVYQTLENWPDPITINWENT